LRAQWRERDEGQAIVKAILAGERDPYQLAALRNWRVKASEEEIARSLEGNWQEERCVAIVGARKWQWHPPSQISRPGYIPVIPP
jgi:hypothetical protein